VTSAESTTTRDLSISVSDNEGVAVVGLSGRVSVDSSPDLRDRLLATLGRPSLPTLTIDMSELTYIDCSGIATLIEALRIAHQRKTVLQLRGLHDGPRHLLEVTGLLHLFDTNGETDHSSVPKVP
jgi:anti-sigma B factor antagonist